VTNEVCDDTLFRLGRNYPAILFCFLLVCLFFVLLVAGSQVIGVGPGPTSGCALTNFDQFLTM
jgi:peptidoglycan/LPS O-acetylase OafA/YrhL